MQVPISLRAVRSESFHKVLTSWEDPVFMSLFVTYTDRNSSLNRWDNPSILQRLFLSDQLINNSQIKQYTYTVYAIITVDQTQKATPNSSSTDSPQQPTYRYPSS